MKLFLTTDANAFIAYVLRGKRVASNAWFDAADIIYEIFRKAGVRK